MGVQIFSNINGGYPYQCLDIEKEVCSNGTPIILWELNGGNNQKWNLTPDGYIESQLDSNKCLDIQGGVSNNGTLIILWDKNGGDNQKWNFTPDGYIESQMDNNKCIDASGAEHNHYDLHGEYQTLFDNGTPIILWDKNGGKNQKWFLKEYLFTDSGDNSISVSPIADIHMRTKAILDKVTGILNVNTHTWSNNAFEGGKGSVSVSLYSGNDCRLNFVQGPYGVDTAMSVNEYRFDKWQETILKPELDSIDSIRITHFAKRDW